MFALVLRVPIGVAEHPSDAELEALRKDAMALFMERKASEAEAAPPEQAARNEKTRQALAASWLKALGEDRKVVQQQQPCAEEDRSRLHLPPKRPMVILPVDIDIARVLITLQGNPTFAGVVVMVRWTFVSLRILVCVESFRGPTCPCLWTSLVRSRR
ncbi:MAG: hypothetical protein P8176_13675 [Gammaproteobacteria bacterium]